MEKFYCPVCDMEFSIYVENEYVFECITYEKGKIRWLYNNMNFVVCPICKETEHLEKIE